MNGDTLACLEVDGWLDNVDWTWQDDEEEEEEVESDCNAEFTVMQAFGNDNACPSPTCCGSTCTITTTATTITGALAMRERAPTPFQHGPTKPTGRTNCVDGLQ